MNHKPDQAIQPVMQVAPAIGLRVGCDVVNIQRLQTRLQANTVEFAQSLFTDDELALAEPLLVQVFALKEATLKVLGRGLMHGMSLNQLQVQPICISAKPATWSIGLMAFEQKASGRSWQHQGYAYAEVYLQTKSG